jgi:hypothetical protein
VVNDKNELQTKPKALGRRFVLILWSVLLRRIGIIIAVFVARG